jgi:hypothetical protein
MELIQRYKTGAEDWYCPTCHRRFIIQWPPNYKKIVMETGNEYAFHICYKNEADTQLSEQNNILSDTMKSALNDFFNELDEKDA